MEVIINTRLRVSVRLHNILHGLRAGRRTGTEIFELKLVQDLVSMDQEPLFLVLLYLKKAYNTIDSGRILTTLEGYGTSTHMCRLLATFWEQQEVATHQNGYHVTHFRSTRGTTQVRLISITLFILIVDKVVRK